MKTIIKFSLLIFLCLLPITLLAETSIIVDLSSKQIAEVDMKKGIAPISALLGKDNVTKEIEYLEGDPHDLYVINFSGHKVYYHWGGFSIKDPRFQTKKGLRVGSKISDFDRAYGIGELSWSEEGHVIAYEENKTEFVISTEGECIEFVTNQFIISSRDCKSTEIWISNVRKD